MVQCLASRLPFYYTLAANTVRRRRALGEIQGAPSKLEAAYPMIFRRPVDLHLIKLEAIL